MLANPFIPATKLKSRARLAFIGAPGSGKTWMALETGTRLAELRKGKIAVIDTEGRSASKYADVFDFDVLDLSGDYSPKQYINAIKAAADNGYAVIIIDSLSHAWNGSNGVLEIVDRTGAKMGGNDFAGWSEGRPAQNNLMNAIINADIDVIVTLRAKVEWSLEKNPKTGKTEPVAIGTKAIQADGVEHEFDLALLVNMDHDLTVRKTRVKAFPGGEVVPDTTVLADGLYAWLTTGTTLTVSRYLETPAGKQELRELLKELNITDNAPYLAALGIKERYSEYTGVFKDMAAEIRKTHAALNVPTEQAEDEPELSTDALKWWETDALKGLIGDVIDANWLPTGATEADLLTLIDRNDFMDFDSPANVFALAEHMHREKNKPADVPTADEVRDTIEHKPGRIDTSDKPIVNGASKPQLTGPKKSPFVADSAADEMTAEEKALAERELSKMD